MWFNHGKINIYPRKINKSWEIPTAVACELILAPKFYHSGEKSVQFCWKNGETDTVTFENGDARMLNLVANQTPLCRCGLWTNTLPACCLKLNRTSFSRPMSFPLFLPLNSPIKRISQVHIIATVDKESTERGFLQRKYPAKFGI